MQTELKGVVLAGGTGSRLLPLTKVTNKHLLPVGREPMIFHPLRKLTGAGITRILVVTGTEHMGAIVQLLGSGRDFGCEFTYRVQDEAGGIAQALALAKDFTGDSRFVVILGDNIFEDELAPFVESFRRQPDGARVLLKEVPDPTRFGVPTIEGDRITAITEKPKRPATSYAVTGVYMYFPEVFGIIATLKPSARGELEISHVNDHYAKARTLRFDILSGWWSDAGTFESIKRASELLEG